MTNFRMSKTSTLAALLLAGTLAVHALQAQEAQPTDAAAELAKKLANPIASLISVPLQYNYDRNYGADDEGSRSVLNIQPVMPFSLGPDWNLITRTIIPLVDQNGIPPGVDESGLGDILQSFFLSPREPVGGWIVGAGPVFLYPSASEDVLGGEKWGAGPTAIALRQTGPWTYGVLANHLWSYAGDDDRADVNATFLQPFASYITRTKTTLSVNTESSYDWEAGAWSVPVNAQVSQLLKIGPQIFQISAGVRYWADAPDNGPEGFGLRIGITFLFPK